MARYDRNVTNESRVSATLAYLISLKSTHFRLSIETKHDFYLLELYEQLPDFLVGVQGRFGAMAGLL